MANKITDLTNFNPADANNPDGSLKDQVYSGGVVTETGSRAFGRFIQDILNPFHRLGRKFGKLLNGSSDTQSSSQFYDWIAAGIKFIGSNFYTSSFSASNVWVLTSEDSPIQYSEGLIIRFKAPEDNTSEILTVNCNSLGAIQLNLNDGFIGGGGTFVVRPGAIKAGDYVTAIYSLQGGAHFEILGMSISQLLDGEMQIDKVDGTTTDTIKMEQGEFRIQKYNSSTDYTQYSSVRHNLISCLTVDSNGYLNIQQISTLSNSIRSSNENADGTIDVQIKPTGLLFAGDRAPGNNSGKSRNWRLAEYEIPDNDPNIEAISNGGTDDWVIFDNTGIGENYELETNIKKNSYVGDGFCSYITVSGTVRETCPCRLRQVVEGAETTHKLEIIILSGDSNETPTNDYKPDTSKGINVHVWFDGLIS